MAQRLRESDKVARLGGDEVGGAVMYEGKELPLSASAGVAVFSDDGMDPETLVAQADARLYDDKRSRKGR